METQASTTPIIGVKIVQSKKIGVLKHEKIYPILAILAILFFICEIAAVLNLIKSYI